MILSNLKSNFFAESDRWFLWVPVLFGAGIGFYFSLFSEPPTWLLLTLFEILLFLIYIFKKKTSVLLFLSCILIFLFGILCIKAHTLIQIKEVDFPNAQETTYLKGTVFQTDLSMKGKTRLWLKDVSDFDNQRKGIYRITISDKKQVFKVGNCVEMAATISAPSEALIPGGFEFNRHAFYQGISAIGYNESNVYQIDCEKSPSFSRHFHNSLFKARQNISSYILKTLPLDEAAIASTVMVGNRNFISQSLYDKYRNSGLAHFLSISGLHMGFISAFAFFLIRFLMVFIAYLSLRYSSKKCAALGAILFSFIYLLFSGFAVPAERAFIMTSLVLIAVLLDKEAISMRTVAFAALIILIIEPYALLTPGFQMSFASVIALVSFYEAWREKFHWRVQNYFLKFLFYVLGISLTTLIASLATLPFCLYHFGTLAPFAILGNILAAPIISFIVMPFIFIALFLFPFHLSFYPLKIAGFGIGILNQITSFVSNLSFSSLSLNTPPLWSVVLISFGALWLMLWQRRWRFLGFILILFGVFFFALSSKPDILYSSNGQNVAIRFEAGELTVFTSQKNNFLNQVWQENTPVLKIQKKLQSMPRYDFYCSNDKCVYQKDFAFDLKGFISFQNQIRNPLEDLGGAIYLSRQKSYLQTVRKSIGSRPWNK